MFWKNDDKADQFKKIVEKMQLSILWFGAYRTLWRLVNEGHVSRDVVVRIWTAADVSERRTAAQAVPELAPFVSLPLDIERTLDECEPWNAAP